VDRQRVGDVVIGSLLVSIGAVPLGLVVLGRAQLVSSNYAFGALLALSPALLELVLASCGLLAIAAGVLVLRYGRQPSAYATLY
jgi:hypothetical protein